MRLSGEDAEKELRRLRRRRHRTPPGGACGRPLRKEGSMTSRRDYGDGGLDQRGDDQWRLRWRVGGKRYSKAFHGTKRAAQAELRRIVMEADTGAAVAPIKLTVRQHLGHWLDGMHGLSAKTRERYKQLVE